MCIPSGEGMENFPLKAELICPYHTASLIWLAVSNTVHSSNSYGLILMPKVLINDTPAPPGGELGKPSVPQQTDQIAGGSLVRMSLPHNTFSEFGNYNKGLP